MPLLASDMNRAAHAAPHHRCGTGLDKQSGILCPTHTLASLVAGSDSRYNGLMNPELREKGYAPPKGLLEPMNAELCEKGYVLSKGLIEPSLARYIYKTLLLKQWRGECFRDNHIPTAASVANSAETDALLLELRPKIEAVSGLHLVPTYSYARLYFYGDTMIRHHDRGSCEISVSIHLGRDGGEASLWFAPNNKVEMEAMVPSIWAIRPITGESASPGTPWVKFSCTTSWQAGSSPMNTSMATLGDSHRRSPKV